MEEEKIEYICKKCGGEGREVVWEVIGIEVSNGFFGNPREYWETDIMK